ncbi:MAG: hypothetical protein ACTSRG_08980, partial [Candidatus Helarchaeota archaeon]
MGKIQYLFKLVKNITIPKAVFDEVVVKGKLENFFEAFTIENYIKEEKIIVANLNSFDDSFYPPLGKGELEALELAKEKDELLLIDEKKARNLAQILQIEHQTTIATIFELLISKNIDY